MTRADATTALGFAILLTTLAAAPAGAALAPWYQRSAELQAVVQAAVPLLEPRPIDAVEHAGDELYRVKAGSCSLEVAIVDVATSAQPMVGPRRFEAKPGAVRCD